MIYEPREDSYLFKQYIEGLNLEGKKCLDMGTGSGILAEAMLESGAEKVSAADINPEASEKVSEKVKFVESDLFERIDSDYDLIVFNPPYLPEDRDEGLEGKEAWRGGVEGTELTERFLDQAFEHLNGGGVIVTMLSSLADFGEIEQKFDFEVIEELNLWFERLYLIKLKE